MTKHYHDKDMFFSFKKPIKSKVETDSNPLANTIDLTDTEKGEKNPTQELESYQRSIARTRREMNDLTEMNDFDMFATFTFDPKKHNPYDKKESIRKINRWLANQKALYGDFRYLMVAEPTKDGKTHLHALLGGFTGKYHEVPLSKKQQNRKIPTLKAYKLDGWEQNYGFADAENIIDKQRLTNYIVKYISKDIDTDFHEKGKKRYYASKNLVRPEKTYNENLENIVNSGKYDIKHLDVYENEYVTITTLPKKTDDK